MPSTPCPETPAAKISRKRSLPPGTSQMPSTAATNRAPNASIGPAAIASAMRTQVNPVRIAEAMAAGPIDAFGARLVAAVLGIWEVPGGGERFRLIFAAGVSGQGVDGIRDYLTQEVYARVAKRLDGPDAQLRMNLAASQLAGLMMARYGLRLEPLASTPVDELARRVGPVIQQYLEPLAEPSPRMADDPARTDLRELEES